MERAAEQLGYTGSSGFVSAENLEALPCNELRFGCRKARETSGLKGIYLVRDPEGRNNIPVVFLCEAATETEARKIHRNIWNLNLVPFVVVETPTRIRVYPGFSYEAADNKDLSFVDASLANATEVLERLEAFRAEAIDCGRVFQKWGDKVTPKRRVDEHLLKGLQILDGELRKIRLAREPSHSLIGKYVWLSYLRDRGILSEWRLEKAGVKQADVFSEHAKLNAFYALDDYLQQWLNGEIFPLRGEDRRSVKAEHLQKVAGVFAGHEATGQRVLFTDLYDFSHVPIETLSVVYEQFLHHKEEGDERSEGEESGAYYTPVALADFMIEEMDRKVKLRDGVGVFDPACGSGVFLVQAYRRLVERTMEQEKRKLKLTELRSLLINNIFGVDRDADACRVSRMSLAIALLDYADPPDVSGPSSSFKLPSLSQDSIVERDFFELDPTWPQTNENKRPGWIVGNPPWVELKRKKKEADTKNEAAWNWLEANKQKRPTSGNQVAEAFVWRLSEFSGPETIVGLVLPAMTLFKHEAKRFRQGVFSKLNVWLVTNFANLAYVLFAGRATRPAACLFYKPAKSAEDGDGPILSIAPLIADQTANVPANPGEQLPTWNILVRAQDCREVTRKEAEKGERLTWKLAMWGSFRDAALLKRLTRFPTLKEWRTQADVILAAGPEVRKGPGEGLTFVQEFVGKRSVSFKQMRGQTALFNVPKSCLSEPLPKEHSYLRERGGRKGLAVCKPPHVLINKARRFAIFSNEFLLIPPGENGIFADDASLLKALALYIISPVARWHQFFVSSEWGISTSVARLEDLDALPIPLSRNDRTTIEKLAGLYDELANDEQRLMSQRESLLIQAADVFWRELRLETHERDLVEGFFEGPYECIKGKFPADAVQPAAIEDIERYCRVLARELDGHLEGQGVSHEIAASLGDKHVCITIEGRRTERQIEPVIAQAKERESQLLLRVEQRLRQKHSQHTYFEKSLFLYEKGRLLFLKNRRRLEWNVRQALLDANELIAELLSTQD
jgi:hypothetical protein